MFYRIKETKKEETSFQLTLPLTVKFKILESDWLLPSLLIATQV